MAEVMAAARKWIYLNWLSICLLTGLFLWKHTEVLFHLAPSATSQALGTSWSTPPYYTAYNKWYAQSLREGTAFWFPDLLFAYFIIPSFIALQVYMCKMADNAKLITFWFGFPGLFMASQMLINLNVDTLLYLNVLPKGPLCGCLNSTSVTPALYDCQCYIPFHEGTARVQTADPTNVTRAEYLAAGVAEDQLPTGNLTIKYMAETHDLDSLNTWDVEALTWEFALAQCSIFVVLTRLKPFLLFQREILGETDNSLFSAVLSHIFYLLAECADALSLFEEFFEHGDYFVNRPDLVKWAFLPMAYSMNFLMYSSCPVLVIQSSKMKFSLQIQRLITKGLTLLCVNIPLLVIRCYLVSLYGDEVKISIIFALFIVREVGMMFMGTLEFIYEIIVLVQEKKKLQAVQPAFSPMG